MAALDPIHVKLTVDTATVADYVASLTAENERYAAENARLTSELEGARACVRVGNANSREAAEKIAALRANIADLRKMNSELGDALHANLARVVVRCMELEAENARLSDLVRRDAGCETATDLEQERKAYALRTAYQLAPGWTPLAEASHDVLNRWAVKHRIEQRAGETTNDFRARIKIAMNKPADPRSAALARAVAADRPLDGWAR